MKGDVDFLLSPMAAPDELLVQDGQVMFPPTRIVFSGHDPLRDTSILFILKMAKLGVDIKGVDYQHQMHGFLMFVKGPICFKEGEHAINKCIEYTKDLVGVTYDA
jgi:acetyl esterase/lipase